jgi:hypothetical protein
MKWFFIAERLGLSVSRACVCRSLSCCTGRYGWVLSTSLGGAETVCVGLASDRGLYTLLIQNAWVL